MVAASLPGAVPAAAAAQAGYARIAETASGARGSEPGTFHVLVYGVR